jgi:hypothetical protein
MQLHQPLCRSIWISKLIFHSFVPKRENSRFSKIVSSIHFKPFSNKSKMSRAVLQPFEEYQKARVTFVQTVAELATRPQNIDAL